MTDVAITNGFASQQTPEKTPFEKQRDILIGQITQVIIPRRFLSDIFQSMEQIITNMNLLNRSIEGIIAVILPMAFLSLTSVKVGKEFESVSTLWRSFHEVLAKGEAQQGGDGDEREMS